MWKKIPWKATNSQKEVFLTVLWNLLLYLNTATNDALQQIRPSESESKGVTMHEWTIVWTFVVTKWVHRNMLPLDSLFICLGTSSFMWTILSIKPLTSILLSETKNRGEALIPNRCSMFLVLFSFLFSWTLIWGITYLSDGSMKR